MSWHRVLPALVLAVTTAACTSPPSNAPEVDFAAIMADYERLDKAIDPVTAGSEGDREALGRLPDVRPETIAGRKAALVALSERLRSIDAARLGPDAATNHTLLARKVAQLVDEIDFDLARIPFNNDSGFHTLGDYLARTTQIHSREDADAWLSRLAALPAYYEQNVANLRRGIRDGVTQPRLVVDRVLAVATAHAEAPPEESAFLLPFSRLPEAMAADAQAEYRAKAEGIVRDAILPAQRAFAAFLETEYLPAARSALGWRSTPNGEASYRFLVRRETTTSMSPDEIHALGVSEVARIRGLMDEAMREAKFAGSFDAFLRMLRTDSRFYARTPEGLLERASEIAKRADDKLPQLFGRLPRLPYGVRPVPADIAEGYTTGRYWPGSLTQGQAGGYMVNVSRLDQRPLYELPALTLHEAVPGHHLQIAIAQELGELPYFRRNLNPTVFVEGWGLYAEFLGEEMGIYRDPYEKFGRYSYEMWRACRLVADTGLHWLGWSLEQARRCFTENSALAPHNIQTELERYVSWPAQALAYKIGELKFRALRREAETALGEAFSVRGFHDVVLGGGALPLDALEARVRSWIASQKR